jgi:hypothetical protein
MKRAPAVLPAVGDVDRPRAAEDVPEALLALCVRVRGELDPTLALHFLEPFREQLEHGRARLLRPVKRNLDRDSAEAAQRNALFSLSKKLSSAA